MTALRGLCSDHPDPEMWWSADPAPAIAICGRCPTRAACLAWALERDETEGVWGGKAAEERLGDVMRLDVPEPVELVHTPSHNCYTQGCDSGECQKAHAAYVAERRRITALSPPPKRRRKHEGQGDLTALIDVTAGERVSA